MDYTAEDIQAAMRDAAQDNNSVALHDLSKMLTEVYANDVRNSTTSGMSSGQKAWANLGAGMMEIGRGVGQSFGQVSSEDVRAAHRRDDELAKSLPYAGRTLQFVGSTLPLVAGTALAAAASPALAAGMATLPGAAATGGITGALLPTENENQFVGKAQNAALGAATSYLGAKYIPRAVDALSRGGAKARDFAVRQGIGTQTARQGLAERQLLADIGSSSDDAAQAIRTGMADEIPGVQPTTGQLTNSRQLLATERALRESGGAAGAELRAQMSRSNDARLSQLRSALGADPDVISDNASRFAEAAKARMSLKPGGVDPKGFLKGRVTAWANRIENPSSKAQLLALRERLVDIQAAPESQQLDLIHQFRRTALRDTLDAAYKTDKQAAKVMRVPLKAIENNLDDYLEARLATGDWKGFIKGYASRMRVRDQAQAAKEILGKIETASPLSTGEPGLQASRQMLRKAIAPENATNAYGTGTFSPQAREVIDDIVNSLDLEKRAYAADVGPVGSATAENLRTMSRLGAGQNWSPQEVMSAVGAGLVNPVGAGAVVGQRVLAHRAQQDIARRLLTLYGDPAAALRVLQSAGLPEQVNAGIAQTLLELAGATGRAGLPLAGVSAGNAIAGAQAQ